MLDVINRQKVKCWILSTDERLVKCWVPSRPQARSVCLDFYRLQTGLSNTQSVWGRPQSEQHSLASQKFLAGELISGKFGAGGELISVKTKMQVTCCEHTNKIEALSFFCKLKKTVKGWWYWTLILAKRFWWKKLWQIVTANKWQTLYREINVAV